jgi:uncharacterized protein (TIRG00374 family)
LLFLSLRETPLDQIVRVIGRLRGGQILLLVAVNLAFLVLVNVRWALLLRSLGWKIPLPVLMLYRLTGFGVSYFSPGPQFGGEPVQVHLLHRQSGVPLSTAVSSVFLDRLVDLLANFTFLFIGCLVVLTGGLLDGWQGRAMWLLALVLFLLPAVHLLALSLGRQPVTWLLARFRPRRPIFQKIIRLAGQSEKQIGGLVRANPGVLAAMIGMSALVWSGAVLEFWMCLRFLGVEPSGAETISAMTAARLAFLLPLPGGLGALEASQALAARLLGWGPAVGLALSLVIRARDVFLALTGLGLGGFAYRSFLFTKERS